MKTEAHRPLSPDPSSASGNPGVRTGRWLADLENAWIGAFGHIGPEPAAEAETARFSQGARPSGGREAQSFETPSGTGGDQSRPQRLERLERAISRAEARQPGQPDSRHADSRPTTEQQVQASDADSAQLSARWAVATEHPAVSSNACIPSAQVYQGVVSSANVPAPAAGSVVAMALQNTLQPLGGQPSVVAVWMGVSGGRRSDALIEEMPAARPQPPSAEPRQFARRLMQVAGDQELQLNLRDAAVQGDHQQAVARELFDQLHAAGMPLRRLYINGQRFVYGETLASHGSDSTEQE